MRLKPPTTFIASKEFLSKIASLAHSPSPGNTTAKCTQKSPHKSALSVSHSPDAQVTGRVWDHGRREEGRDARVIETEKTPPASPVCTARGLEPPWAAAGWASPRTGVPRQGLAGGGQALPARILWGYAQSVWQQRGCPKRQKERKGSTGVARPPKLSQGRRASQSASPADFRGGDGRGSSGPEPLPQVPKRPQMRSEETSAPP